MTTPSRRNDVDRVLRDVFRVEGETAAPSRILEGVFGRTRHGRQAWRRPWDGRAGWRHGRVVRLLVVAAALVVASTWLLGVGGGGTSPGQTPGPPSASTAAAPPPPVVRACGNGAGLAGDAGTLWVACPGGLQSIDLTAVPPTVGAILPGVGLPSTGGAGTWAPAANGIVELDESGGVIRTLPITGVSMLAVGDASIFVAGADGSLRALDPGDGSEARRVPVPGRPLAILATPDSIWLGGSDGFLRRYDATTLDLLGTFPAGGAPARLAATSTAIYALSLAADGLLTRVDLASGVVTSGKVGDPADAGALGELAAKDAGVWLTRRETLVRADERTFGTLGSILLPAYPAGIVVLGTDAWVYGAGRVDKVALP